MKPEPFEIRIPDAKLDDLRRRLGSVNWAPELANEDWRYGTQGAYLRELVAYWRDGYDWRARERELNAHEHARVEIEGIPIHFMRVPGKGPRPVPLVLTHGWPWTFWDFHRVVGPLADPGAHGGDPDDAFEVIVPSLPGYALSTPLERTGINFWRTGDLWVSLMRDALGHERFFAHGGDWGALVTMHLGHRHADTVRGIHLTNAFPLDHFSGPRPWAIGDAASAVPDPDDGLRHWERKFASHVAVHVLDPQTLAWALHDSPVGLLAWLLERRRAWSDCGGDVERRFSRDHLLTTTMLFWATDSFASSLRFYSEAGNNPWKPSHDRTPVVEAPTGISFFRGDMAPGPIDWTADYYNRTYVQIHESGGHFAPAEEPEAVVDDIRATFRPLRETL